MSLLWLCGLLVAGSCGVGIAILRGRRPVDSPRWIVAALPPAFALLAVVYVSHVAGQPEGFWNAPRTTNSVALAQGHGLYAGVESGAMRTTIYGPVKEILYLPAALASRPSPSIWIAGTLNCLAILAPLLFVLVIDRRRQLDAGHAIPRARLASAFLFGGGALLLARSTHYMATKVHVDAPAVGLGLVSCALLLGGSGEDRRLGSRRLAAAALFAALATWTKQVDLFLAGGQIPWLALVHGRRIAARYIAWLALFGCGLGLVFVALFGFEPLYLHLVAIPRGHPSMGTSQWLWISAVELLVASSFGLLLALLSLRRWRATAEAEIHHRPFLSFLPFLPFLRARPWTLLLFVAAALAPLAILGRTIQGGDINSYHPVYFLLAAAALILMRGEITDSPSRANGLVHGLAAVALVAVLPQIDGDALANPWENPQEEAYRFALAHPRSAYFPWETLSGLHATGRLDHFDHAVAERLKSGHPPTPEHLRAHLPPDLRWVLYRDGIFTTVVLDLLPGTYRRTTLPEMPGWRVYERVLENRVLEDRLLEESADENHDDGHGG